MEGEAVKGLIMPPAVVAIQEAQPGLLVRLEQVVTVMPAWALEGMVVGGEVLVGLAQLDQAVVVVLVGLLVELFT